MHNWFGLNLLQIVLNCLTYYFLSVVYTQIVGAV